MTPCDLVDVHLAFLEKYSVSIFEVKKAMMEAAPSSESSAIVYRFTRRDVPSYSAVASQLLNA
jgi:hypothetical protein